MQTNAESQNAVLYSWLIVHKSCSNESTLYHEECHRVRQMSREHMLVYSTTIPTITAMFDPSMMSLSVYPRGSLGARNMASAQVSLFDTSSMN